MFDDPRTRARVFLESSSIISELEDVLNHLVFEKPDDLHGFLANHFLGQSKQPQIVNLTLRQLIGPANELAMHIDLTIAIRNGTERHKGITVNCLSSKFSKQAAPYIEELISSASLLTLLNQIDLYDQTAIDELLANFRSNRMDEMLRASTAEAEAMNGESALVTPAKTPPTARGPASAGAPKGSTTQPSSKKTMSKDIQSVEIIPDEPEPMSFPGQLLITGISLTSLMIAAKLQQTNLFRLIQLPTVTNLSMPLPIIPILQSGPAYPGKQGLIKYFMLIPTPNVIHNEEWMHKIHDIIHFLRESLSTTKGATLQSTYSTDDGCLVFPLDKAEQGFDLLQNAINSVCGTDEVWFDFAVQMGPYETFDYIRGRYEISTGVLKTPDELIETYVEWIDAYPRCIMLIDPFRYADKPALSRLCDRISNRCYITSTDIRRYRPENNTDETTDYNTMNCHFLSLNSAPTITEFMHQINTVRESNKFPLGLFERDHQEVAQVHLADLTVALGCRFIKLPGLLSLGGQRTSSILQRLCLIRDEIEANDDDHFEWPKKHEFIHIRSSIEVVEQEAVISPSPTNAKTKDKKKRS